jgi:hypothetical protein
VFQSVVFGAGLAEIGDAGSAAVGPGEDVVGVVVQGVVVAVRERAFRVAEAQPLAHRFREAVAGASDLQRRSVPWVCEDPQE